MCKALRYFEINGKNCRALPFQQELLGSNLKGGLAKNNMFVRRIPKSDSAAILENYFSKYGEIISCKVSLGSDHKSKGYGFVCFRDAAATQKAIEETQGAETRIGVKFAPKCKKDFKKVYNNIYVKNMPANWDVTEVLNQFSPFGHITSVHPGESQLGEFFLICFGSADPADHEAGTRSGERSVIEMDGRDFDGHKL